MWLECGECEEAGLFPCGVVGGGGVAVPCVEYGVKLGWGAAAEVVETDADAPHRQSEEGVDGGSVSLVGCKMQAASIKTCGLSLAAWFLWLSCYLRLGSCGCLCGKLQVSRVGS